MKRQETQIWHADAFMKPKMTWDISNQQLCLKLAARVFLISFYVLCFSIVFYLIFSSGRKSNVSLKMDQWCQIKTVKKAGKADIWERKNKKQDQLTATSHMEHKKKKRSFQEAIFSKSNGCFSCLFVFLNQYPSCSMSCGQFKSLI